MGLEGAIAYLRDSWPRPLSTLRSGLGTLLRGGAGTRAAAKLLTRDEARRIAANIAKTSNAGPHGAA